MPHTHIGIEFGGEPANLIAMAQGDGLLVEGTFLHSIDSRGIEEGYSDKEYEFIGFIAAVIRSGLGEEGPNYLHTPGGQFWCWLGGLEPQVVWEQAVYLGYRRPEPEEAK